MTYYMYFIQTLIIRCTVSEILAPIDHKVPSWTFLTLKITFRVSPYLTYFNTGLVSQQRRHMMQYIWAALCYYWIISITRIGVFAQGHCVYPRIGWPKITFDCISRHFRSIHNYFLNVFTKFSPENHFQSHFSPFQINAQLQFFC